MTVGIAVLVGGVALYALAGSALSGRLARCAQDCSPRKALRLVPLAVGGPLALASAACGAALLYDDLDLQPLRVSSPALAMLCVAPVGLVAGALLLLAVFPRRGGGGGGGGRDDDLPPPPDPDGPDGWAEFERGFRAYADARDRVLVLAR